MRFKNIKRKTAMCVFALVLLPAPLMASAQPSHSGGTDKNGCHVCRTNCARYGM